MLLWLVFFGTIVVSCTDFSKNKKINESAMNVKVPTADKMDTVLKEHGRSRIDPYFWIRLTDSQKKSETPDDLLVKCWIT